jgi:SHS2 domain-containing protein
VVIFGHDMAELLRHAAAALYDLTITLAASCTTHCRIISIESIDNDALLVDWLNELVYLLYAERAFYSEFRFVELGDGHLIAQCSGGHLAAGGHQIHREVKAATHHMVHISKADDGYTARVVLDV